MAKATKTDDVYKQVLVSKGGVNMELTADEAEALFTLLGKTHMDGPLAQAYYALKNANVNGFAYHLTTGLNDDYVKTLNLKKR